MGFDELLNQFDKVSSTARGESPLLVLIDFSEAGLPPLRYIFQRSQEYLRTHPVRPKTRAAYLYPPGALISVVQSFLSVLDIRNPYRFFPIEEKDRAYAWLLAPDDER